MNPEHANASSRSRRQMSMPRTQALPSVAPVSSIPNLKPARWERGGCTQFTPPFIPSMACAGSPQARIFRRTLAFLVLGSVIAGSGVAKTSGSTVTIMENGQAAMKPKSGNLRKKAQNANGVFITTFNFHGPDAQVGHYQKILGNPPSVLPALLRHTYSLGEEHGTTGWTEYKPTILAQNGGFVVKTKTQTQITPGNNNRVPVQINSKQLDPFTFSDANLDANFEFAPGGIDYSFSLGEGTAFPVVFSRHDGLPGAMADGTEMIFRARVASGVQGDPEAFWGDGSTGAIDLYTLTITSDVEHEISASLSFGISTADFILDYRDSLGNPLDPEDPVAVASIEQLIADSFTDGVVLSDSTDFFTVGFVPNGAIVAGGEYTAGAADELSVTAMEVPEPATLGLLALGGPMMVLRRRR